MCKAVCVRVRSNAKKDKGGGEYTHEHHLWHHVNVMQVMHSQSDFTMLFWVRASAISQSILS